MELLYTKSYRDGTKDIFVPHKSNMSYNILKNSKSLLVVPVDFDANINVPPDLPRALSDDEIAKNITDARNRARKTVFDLAVSNDWEYFFTQTIKSDFMDRTDVDGAFAALRKILRKLKADYPSFKCLIVAEYHKKKELNGKRALHFHGLFAGLPDCCLGKKYRTKSGFAWSLPDFEHIGWCGVSKVRDNKAASRYLVKYITKDFVYRGKHKASYIASRGLARPIKRRYFVSPGVGLKINMLKEMFDMLKGQRYDAHGSVTYTFFDCFVSDDDLIKIVDEDALLVNIDDDAGDFLLALSKVAADLRRG